MGWTISGAQGATIDANGRAYIPANTSTSARDITVTYTDGDCSCTKTLTQAGSTPACYDYTDYGYGTGSATADKCGGTVRVDSDNIPYTSYTCTVNVTGGCDCVESDTGYTSDWENVYIEQNTTSSSKTHTGYKGKIYYTITQEAGPCTEPITCTTCTCYSAGSADGTASADDTSATVTWSYTSYTYDSSCNITTATSTSSATVTFDKNTGTSEVTRTGTLTWSGYKACETSGCSSSDETVSWSVEQGGVDPGPCSITDIDYGDVEWDDHDVTVTYKLNGVSKSQTFTNAFGSDCLCYDGDDTDVTIGEGDCTETVNIVRNGAPVGSANYDSESFGPGGGSTAFTVGYHSDAGLDWTYEASADEGGEGHYSVSVAGDSITISVDPFSDWDVPGGVEAVGVNVEIFELDECGVQSSVIGSFTVTTRRHY